MDYTARYGLEFNPFLKNSKEVYVDTQEQKEVLYRLDYLASTKGFGLLTGSAGRGKTTAVRNWAASLKKPMENFFPTGLLSVLCTFTLLSVLFSRNCNKRVHRIRSPPRSAPSDLHFQ